MSALGTLAFLAALGVGLLIVFAAISVPLKRMARRRRAAIEDELGAGILRMDNAQGLGLESRGRGQVRGNGWLVLTADELRFRQWVPQRESRIPLASITTVETRRSWLGKTVGSRLLCVRWRLPDGSEDAMAWALADLDAWLAALPRPSG